MKAYGLGTFKLTFKQCGTIVFVLDRQANTYAGISNGRGRIASCRIPTGSAGGRLWALHSPALGKKKPRQHELFGV